MFPASRQDDEENALNFNGTALYELSDPCLLAYFPVGLAPGQGRVFTSALFRS